jgi:hypothetical protein
MRIKIAIATVATLTAATVAWRTRERWLPAVVAR